VVESEESEVEVVDPDADQLATAVCGLGRVMERFGKAMGKAFGEIADALEQHEL
jgi:hypothetical protein